ncbi:MAB_1171c family putative transporter [Streptomyces sp. NPDC060048]|uniref:MAB_1171c family putative transporter n=1 Tax=unclassified Streptomyces TaxID=2593676 RepID=UPI003690F1DF
MADYVTCLIAALLLLQAVLRVPSALRGRIRERSLWGALTAFAAAWLITTRCGTHLVNSMGVDELATLLEHVLSVAGSCVLLRYVAAVYQDGGPGAPLTRTARLTRVLQRYGSAVSVVVIAAMTAVFLLGLDRGPVPEDSHFMDRHAGEADLATYVTLFYGHCGVVIALCGSQWARATREAHRPTLRAGLALMTAGMAAGAVYTALRTVYGLVIAARPVPAHIARVEEAVADGLLYATFLCWALGVLAPATQTAVNRRRTFRALAGLHPLWRDLALTAPDLVRQAPSRLFPGSRAARRLNTLRDLTAHDGSAQVRLGRYVTEIRDVIHSMRRQAPDDLYQLALELAESEGHLGLEAEAAAQAYWIMSARLNMRDPVRAPGVPAEFPSSGDDFCTEEVPWLLRVSAVYAKTDCSIASEVLADAHA